MKKILLLLILCCSHSLLNAQIFSQPSQFNHVCDDNNDGIGSFYMGEISYEILAGQNAQNFTVTHHLTQADAASGLNPLPGTFTNTVNPQLIFARIVNNQTSQVTITTYNLTVNPQPNVPHLAYTSCDFDSDGLTFIDLGSVMEMIWGASQNSNLALAFFNTMEDAQSNLGPIQQPFYNTQPFQQTIYVRETDQVTGCVGFSSVDLIVSLCTPPCPAPYLFGVNNVTPTTAVLSWQAGQGATHSDLFVTVAGAPAPLPTTMPTAVVSTPPFTMGGLACGTTYSMYVRTVCSPSETSQWVGPFMFNTMPCFESGQPSDLTQCNDGGPACFNLHDNDAPILANLDPSGYTLTYHLTQQDASTGANPIANADAYCISQSGMLFARLENTTTQQYQIFVFNVNVLTIAFGTLPLPNMAQCDDDQDGSISFDLTAAQAQIANPQSITYYQNYNDAVQLSNPIATPAAYVVPTTTTSLMVYVRNSIAGDCDSIYSITILPSANCNLSASCITANSLCHALGMPFTNSQNTTVNEPGADYGCLGTHPNPTWFYLPVSSAGAINLIIQQAADLAFTTSLDVDYIVYGPFSTPATPCFSQLTTNNIVSCSYSINATEYPVIPNALPGQYYLIMTTNFSNIPGYIRINELSTTVGEISCSGFRLNAFLDSNNNGTKESGEANFPLGQFHFEKNNDGNVHNISSPSGIYNLYDENGTNTYDLSYSIDSEYTGSYSVSPASYADANIVIGGGMQVYNFPVTVTQPYNDLAVSIIPLGQPAAGFVYQNKIVYANLGNQTIASGTISFTKDPITTINYTSEVITPNATGFTYNFTNLQPFEVRTLTVALEVPPIPNVTLGQQLTQQVSIAPLAGDIVPENNSNSCTQVVVGSYDPNDKMESHGEQILVTDFTAADFLYYTVRFENTGTANAINIRVTDVLDPALDETSIKMVDASADYILDRVDNALTWKFENIMLPPSIANTSTGKGYITFKVKPRPGYAVGDFINNTASIYFDFNPAIVTNTYRTEFVSLLAINEFEKDNFAIYPNPTADIVNVSLKNNSGFITKIAVTDMLGKQVYSKKITENVMAESVSLKDLSAGIYFIEVTTNTNMKAVKKLVKK